MTKSSQLIRKRLKELGRSRAEAARLGGANYAFINDLFIGKKKTVNSDNLPNLAAALSWSVEETRKHFFEDEQPDRTDGDMTESQLKSKIVNVTNKIDEPKLYKEEYENFNKILNRNLTPGNLDIRRLSEFLDDSLMVSQDVVDTIPMPERLANVPDAYGLFVAGLGMAPRYRPGDTILIHPHMEPRADDGVVIYSPDNHLARIGEFVRSTPTEWILRRFQPVEEEFALLKSEWPKLHVVRSIWPR